MPKRKPSRKGGESKKTLLRFVDLERAEETAESGMFVDKKDLLILYHALAAYTPSEKEKQLHEILLEQFEEILVTDFGENPPWAK